MSEQCPQCGLEGVACGAWLLSSLGSRGSCDDVMTGAQAFPEPPPWPLGSMGRRLLDSHATTSPLLPEVDKYPELSLGGEAARPSLWVLGGPNTCLSPMAALIRSHRLRAWDCLLTFAALQFAQVLRQQQKEVPAHLYPVLQPLAPCFRFQLETRKVLRTIPAPQMGSFQKGQHDGGAAWIPISSPVVSVVTAASSLHCVLSPGLWPQVLIKPSVSESAVLRERARYPHFADEEPPLESFSMWSWAPSQKMQSWALNPGPSPPESGLPLCTRHPPTPLCPALPMPASLRPQGCVPDGLTALPGPQPQLRDHWSAPPPPAPPPLPMPATLTLVCCMMLWGQKRFALQRLS